MKYEIFMGDVKNKEQFHDLIQETLPCPPYYGRNLDALYDVLTEQGSGWEVVFHGYDEILHWTPGNAEALKSICEDAMTACPDLKIVFED